MAHVFACVLSLWILTFHRQAHYNLTLAVCVKNIAEKLAHNMLLMNKYIRRRPIIWTSCREGTAATLAQPAILRLKKIAMKPKSRSRKDSPNQLRSLNFAESVNGVVLLESKKNSANPSLNLTGKTMRDYVKVCAGAIVL